MTWTKLVSQNQVTADKTNKSEIAKLRSIVKRCISDIKAKGLSDEQRFIIAYDAARTLALMIVRAEGYRPKSFGGHYNIFSGLAVADAGAFQTDADYFQICRKKRNSAEYDEAGIISPKEADELVKYVTQFESEVEQWISKHHPALSR